MNTIQKTYRGASLAEMLVALGIAGSVIFTMLVIAARTSKQAVINQERYSASQAAAEGVEIAIASTKKLGDLGDVGQSILSQICAGDPVNVGVIVTSDEDEPFVYYSGTDLIVPPGEGYEDYALLPMKRGDSGEWELCSECDATSAELLRGLQITKNTDDEDPDNWYWEVKSIVWWTRFKSEESLIIDTRVENVCP